VLAPLLLSPAVIYIIALVGFPFVLAILFAFSDVTTGSADLEWVGFRTFGRILEDPVFLRSLWNTFVFALIANALVVVVANVLARVLTADFKGKWLIRFLVLLPWTTPISLATITWLWTLDSIFSPIDWVLRNLGLIDTNVYWLGRPVLAMGSVIAVHAWRIIPLAAVIMMAGLTAIPTEIKDAAEVDGARFWRKHFEVTIPLMAPVIAVAVLFGFVLTVTDMSVVYVLTRGGPTHATQVLATWAFFKGIEGGALAQGAAIALFLFPVLVAVAALILRMARRWELH
jgi:multiple sugar transport system permease protein